MGLPVAGSGFSASILSRNVFGIWAKNIGVFNMVMCWRLPSARRNSSPKPRGVFSASDAFGLPPASEKRATTGIVAPENMSERE